MSAAAPIEARAADWLAQQDGEHWSAERQRELDAWLAASTAHRVAYLRLHGAWQRVDALKSGTSPARSVRRLATGLGRWRMAAALLLAVGVGAAVTRWPGRHATEYATAIGAHQTVPLADGSRVQLNTDTQLRATVGSDRRTVWLERGEAFFEVAHDAAHPFVVEAGANAGDRRITVLGTRFSVRREGDAVSVRVEEGRVQVEARHAAQPALLGHDEVATVDGAAAPQVTRRTPQQTANDLLWRQGLVVFDQMTLADAVREFNRYNTRKLMIADAATGAIRIGGRFEVGNVDAFVRLLQQGFGVGVRPQPDGMLIFTSRSGS